MLNIPFLLTLIPALPLAAALATAVFGARVLKEKSHVPTIVALAGSFVLSALLVAQVHRSATGRMSAGPQGVGYESVHTLWTWALVDGTPSVEEGGQASPTFRVEVTLRADTLTAMMLCMVTFVSLLVAVYASGYMHGDPGYWRFFTYIPLFVFSMTMLVSVSNFLLLYVFWEAVGVCSYLLIGFWYDKPAAAAAGKKAFLVNRIGDFGFAVAVFLIWFHFDTLDFHDTYVDGVLQTRGVLGQLNLREAGGLPIGAWMGLGISLLLFVGACGKSAQFPLHVWLPDAMEGPTPVSALIHAATMVTAGVYLVTRCAPIFLAGGDPVAHLVVAYIGGFTALLAAVIALTQTDLKRILAYSTISQLGYMFLALGTMTAGGLAAGMFHLFTHAFFKALLFLGAGSVMHAMGGVIDIRRFGGLRRVMPVTHWTFLIGCLALAGVVPFAGFWSKDAILAAVHAGGVGAEQDAYFNVAYQALYYLGLFIAALTAFYTFRAYFVTFHGEEKIPHEAGHHAHESPRVMTLPLVVLAIGAATVWLVQWGWDDYLAKTPSLAIPQIAATAHEHEFHWDVAALSTAAALLGIGLAAFLYLRGPAVLAALTQTMRAAHLYQLSHGKFYLDSIYGLMVVIPLRIFSFTCSFFDALVVDGLVNLFGWIPRKLGALLRPLQVGLVQFYALAMTLGLLVLVFALMRWYG
jgi:NADH-quinone oxidoreductase subunit L